MTGAGDWSAPGVVAAPVRYWVSVDCDVGGELCHVGTGPEPLDGVPELLVADGRPRQVLIGKVLAVCGAACKRELGSLWAWTNLGPEAAVTAAGSAVSCIKG